MHLDAAPTERGPRFAKRSRKLGHPSCGGLGKPLGWGEGILSWKQRAPHPNPLPSRRAGGGEEKKGGNARANLQSAGGGGGEFVNQKRDLPASVIGWGRPARFDRVKIASPMTGFGFGRLFEACFGALAGLVAPRLSFARGSFGALGR